MNQNVEDSGTSVQIVQSNLSEQTMKILSEIFPCKVANCQNSVSGTPPRRDLTAVEPELPPEVLEITPINTRPSAVKKSHKNVKSRLTGKKGSRQNRQQFNQQQPRRNSFDTLPEGNPITRLDLSQMNYTVPISTPLSQTLDEIMTRLGNLETSMNKKVSQPKSYGYNRSPFGPKIE